MLEKGAPGGHCGDSYTGALSFNEVIAPRVTDKSFENVFTEICQSLEKESSHWFIMGDTNLDMNNEKSLCDICVVYDMSN